jgi:hypothetical protein
VLVGVALAAVAHADPMFEDGRTWTYQVRVDDMKIEVPRKIVGDKTTTIDVTCTAHRHRRTSTITCDRDFPVAGTYTHRHVRHDISCTTSSSSQRLCFGPQGIEAGGSFEHSPGRWVRTEFWLTASTGADGTWRPQAPQLDRHRRR